MLVMFCLPTVFASVTCEIGTDNLTWMNVTTTRYGGCVDDDNNMGYAQNLQPDTEYFIRCKNTTHAWGYESFTTDASGEEEPMAALAIVIFILVATGFFIALPFFKKFSENEFLDLILKRCSWLLGIYLMVLNASMVATIASSADIPLTSELFRYMWIFGWGGYLFIVFLVVKTIFQLLEMWKLKKQKERSEL